jgi:GGDEF domain-containing protein
MAQRRGNKLAVLYLDIDRFKHINDSAGHTVEPHRVDQLELHVSASIGIVTYPGDGSSAESLLKNADAAMYPAKDCGCNSYQFFKADMNLHRLERPSRKRSAPALDLTLDLSPEYPRANKQT